MDQSSQKSNGVSQYPVSVDSLPKEARVKGRPGRPKGSVNKHSRYRVSPLTSEPVPVEIAKGASCQCGEILHCAAGHCRVACSPCRKANRHGKAQHEA